MSCYDELNFATSSYRVVCLQHELEDVYCAMQLCKEKGCVFD